LYTVINRVSNSPLPTGRLPNPPPAWAQEVLENLPPPLAKRLVEELYRTQVNQVPMFNGMQEEIVVRIGAPQAGGSRGFF
jgi:hypothetical protein